MVSPPECGVPPLRVPTVTCKSPVRPEMRHRACVSHGGDARAAILGAGSGNRSLSFRSVRAARWAPCQSGILTPPVPGKPCGRFATTVVGRWGYEGCDIISYFCHNINTLLLCLYQPPHTPPLPRLPRRLVLLFRNFLSF